MLDFHIDLNRAFGFNVMPTSGLDYDKHGRIARVKPRAKDQDSRSVTSSGSSRRHRDSSASSNRTALPAENSLQRSESTSSSVSLDQLPGLPESEATSPSLTSSPMLRSFSNISSPATMTSPSIQRTPAFLQAFLEPENDLADPGGDAQATPKAEKSRQQCEPTIEPPKSEPVKIETSKSTLASSDHTPLPTKNHSPESTKAISVQSSSRAGPPPPPTQEPHPKELRQPLPQYPTQSSQGFGHAPPTPAPAYPMVSGPNGPEAFHPSQLTYLPMPQTGDPTANQQALTSQRMMYYPDYGPPPAPNPPPQLQYIPAHENTIGSEYRMELLHRVDSVIPDLHRLLSSYHDVHGALESREHQIRSMEAQKAVESHEEEKRFAKIEREVEAMIKKHSTETTRLKLDISNVDKKCKDLQARLTEEEKQNDDLEDANARLRAERKQAEKKYDEDRAALLHQCSADKDRMVADHRAKQRASHDELQAQIRKADASLSHKEAYLDRAHEEEKQKLETSWAKQKRELQDQHARSLMDLEEKLEAKVKVVDEERRTYLQAREGWDKERETMIRSWEEERGILRKTADEQQKALTTRYEREKNDILKQVTQVQHRTEKDDTALRLQREVEALRAGWEADKFKFQRTTAEFKATAKTLNEHNNRLQRLTETFGETMDVKSR